MEECGILIRQQSSPQLITMKTLFFMTIAILACSILRAQHEPKILGLASLSVEQAEDLINNTEGGKIKRDLVTAAITSRRMDLIKLCFENPHTRGRLLDPVIQIEDKTFKDQIVLMMLRTKSAFWPHDNPFYPSGVHLGFYLGEPFIDTIKRNLPDLPLSPNLPMSDDLIATHAARSKLADRLEAVIEKRDKVVSRPSLGNAANHKSLPNGINGIQADAGEVRQAGRSTGGQSGADGISFLNCSFAFLAFLVLAVLAYRLIKKKSNGGKK